MEFINEYIEILVAITSFILIEVVKPFIKEDKHKKYIPLLSSLLGVLLIFWNHGYIDLRVFTVGLASGGSGTWLFEVVKNFKPKHEEPFDEPVGTV